MATKTVNPQSAEVLQLESKKPTPERIGELQATSRLNRIANELQGERATLAAIARCGSTHPSFASMANGLSNLTYELYCSMHAMRGA